MSGPSLTDLFVFASRGEFTPDEGLETVGMAEIPAFYITQTLVGFGGEDRNRVFLNLPDKTQIMLCDMGEARTETQRKRWRKLAETLSKLWLDRREG